MLELFMLACPKTCLHGLEYITLKPCLGSTLNCAVLYHIGHGNMLLSGMSSLATPLFYNRSIFGGILYPMPLGLGCLHCSILLR